MNSSAINEVTKNDISLSSFEVKDELNPKFWIDNKLNSRVRLRLLDIADDYMKDISIDWVKPEDIILTGSIANYNWSRYSDIDVHIIMDYKKIYKETEFVKDYFMTKKENWSNSHEKLKIYGFPVEIFVEDKNVPSVSSGVYSLERNEWIKEPKSLENAIANPDYVKDYAARIMTDIDNIEKKLKHEKDTHRVEVLTKNMRSVWNRLRGLRKKGLASKSGEMSSGNIIWKIVRRAGYIEKIWWCINDGYDIANSLKESKQKTKRIIISDKIAQELCDK